MTRGRKPKPKQDTTPKPKAGKPVCPSHLDDTAKKEWRRIVKLMDAAGMLSQVDGAILGLYCSAYSKWVEAEEHLKVEPKTYTTPTGYERPNPWINVYEMAAKDLTRAIGQLGLSPTSRKNVRKLELPPEEESRWADIIPLAI